MLTRWLDRKPGRKMRTGAVRPGKKMRRWAERLVPSNPPLRGVIA
jgi:hypothetical protein